MKIIFLSYFSGMVSRGVETYVHELGNRLTKYGHEVVVYQKGNKLSDSLYKTIVIRDDNQLNRSGKLGRIINAYNSINNVLKFSNKVFKELDKDTDIVIATNGRGQSVKSKLWTRKNNSKLVISGQAGPGFDERIVLWSFPDVFIPLTDFQKEWAKKANPFVNVVNKIPNGVDLDKFSKYVQPINVYLPKPIVLCAAALWPDMKRQHLLIKAMKNVDASLLLAGQGEGEDQLNKLGLRLLGKKRFLIKSFKHHEMPGVFASTDLFSFPTSAWESFGIVLVEAMASGLGVVATDDLIRREIVGDAGTFVDPNDIDEYTKALNFALNKDWGNKPRNQAEKFSWDIIAKQYNNLFNELVK